MISTVTGYFRKFYCEAETETEDFNTASKILFTAEVASIDTANQQRDHHLKSADFFDAETFGEIKFVGTKYEGGSTEGKITGELTIRDVTKPITLFVEHGGIVKDPYGQTKAGFTLEAKISRKEFGLVYNAFTEAGSVVVGDEVKISAEIQLIKQ